MSGLARPLAVPIARLRSIPVTTGWGLALAGGTAVISGLAIWLNASAVRQVPDPAVYTTLKNAVAAAVLIGALAASGRAASVRRLDGATWLKLGIVGLIGGSIPFLLFFTGLAQASAPGAAFIHKTLFVWVALLAVPLLSERLGWSQVLAMVVLLVGQVVLAPPNLAGAGIGTGELMILAATGMWAVEVIIVKRLLGSVPVLVVGSARLGIGVVLLVGYLALTGSLGAIGALTAEAWAWVAVTGVLLAGYVGTWFAALRRAPASAVASVLVVGAVITAALQAWSSAAPPTPTTVAGSALLLAAATAVCLVSVRGLRTSKVSA